MKKPQVKRRDFLKAAVASSFLATPALVTRAFAQDSNWPKERTIRWLIGLPPAGTTDPLTRAIAAQLSERLGQKIVIENKTGALQTIAAREVTGAPADGYTLLSIGGPQVYADKSFPVIGRGLDPVIRMVTQPMIVAGISSRPTPDLKHVIAAAKEKPDEWSYATAGYGSSHHVAGELLNSLAGTKMLHVAYRGGGAAIQDAAAGHVPLIVIGTGPVIPHIAAGKMRGYALTTAKRLASLPGVPTMQELGFTDFDLAQWHGVAIKAGTPRAITERFNSEIRAILATPELAKLMDTLGAENGAGTPEDWRTYYNSDIAKYETLMQKLGIKIE
jgi:tripartite-type tricarboxylate transporter receptor subunit TctC